MKWCPVYNLFGRSILRLLAMVCLALASQCVIAAEDPGAGSAEQPQPARRATTLDEELLKDLGPDAAGTELADDLKKMNEAEPGLRQPRDGEDVDPQSLGGREKDGPPADKQDSDPLARLQRAMRDVESRIARLQADTETLARQEKIVRDLNELIRQAKQQQRQGGGQSAAAGSTGEPAPQNTKGREVSQPERRSASRSEAAEASARQSDTSTREQRAEKPDREDMRELLKGVWGQLPARQREQMLQSYEEQFLPKYEQLIADYFRSLAEGESRKP